MKNKFRQTWFLAAGEVNAQGEMSVPLLTSRLIDVATYHANSLGIGNPSMAALGCGWVLSRIAIEMTRYPRVNETYCIETWVEEWNRHFSTRNFRISDADGNAIGHATSVWMVLNYNTRENAGLGHLSLAPDMIAGVTVPVERPARHHVDNPTAERLYTFKYCDLDFYRHVNTVRYVDLLLNSFTLEEMDRLLVARLDISFMHEGIYGDTVKVKMERHGDGRNEFMLEETKEKKQLITAGIKLTPREE